MLAGILLSGCVNIYNVKKQTVEKITTAPEKFQGKRVVLIGWGLDGFEISAIYPTREAAIAIGRPNIQINPASWPWDTTDPFRFTYPYVYRLVKVKVEGTVMYHSKFMNNPHLIDCIITAQTPLEEIRFLNK